MNWALLLFLSAWCLIGVAAIVACVCVALLVDCIEYTIKRMRE